MAAVATNYGNMTLRQIETRMKEMNDALEKKKKKKIYNMEINKHERLTKQLKQTDAAIQKNDAKYKQLIASLNEVRAELKGLSKTKKKIKDDLSKSAAWRCKIREIIKYKPEYPGDTCETFGKNICWVQIPSGDVFVRHGKEMVKMGDGKWSEDGSDYTFNDYDSSYFTVVKYLSMAEYRRFQELRKYKYRIRKGKTKFSEEERERVQDELDEECARQGAKWGYVDPDLWDECHP